MVQISDFHAHIYFDPHEAERARELAQMAQSRFNLSVGYFHLKPVGPHPRGSCQLTVPTGEFGAFATWIAVHRGDLTIFAHASTATTEPIMQGMSSGSVRVRLSTCPSSERRLGGMVFLIEAPAAGAIN